MMPALFSSRVLPKLLPKIISGALVTITLSACASVPLGHQYHGPQSQGAQNQALQNQGLEKQGTLGHRFWLVDPIDTDSLYGEGFPEDTPALLKRVASTATPIVGYNAPLCPSIMRVNRRRAPDYDICSTQFVVLMSPILNAYLDAKPAKHERQTLITPGGELTITSSLVRILSRDELAFVISHELAHHIAQHNLDEGRNPEMESDADRIAIFLMARAGYDMRASVTMLTKVVGVMPLPSGTHPEYTARVELIEQVISEVEELKRLGDPLIP